MEKTLSEIRALIDDNIPNERDRIILKRLLTDGVTIERAAEEMEVSPRTVDNIKRRWREKIRELL